MNSGTANPYLQASSSPITNKRGFQAGADFDLKTDRNIITTPKVQDGSITDDKIDSLSFNKASGGTLVLGGTGNGNGVMLVKNSVDTTVVTVNNAGIAINDGNITIENSGGTTIIDGSGLVSTANFPSDQVINSTGYTTASTSLIDVTGSSLAAFTLDRTTRVLITVQAQLRNDSYVDDGSSAELVCNSSVDGDLITFDSPTDWYLTSINEDAFGFITSWDIDTQYRFMGVSLITDLSAGSHVLKLRFRVDGTGTARIGTYILSYIVLGT
jgi:hypothetical protein